MSFRCRVLFANNKPLYIALDSDAEMAQAIFLT